MDEDDDHGEPVDETPAREASLETWLHEAELGLRQAPQATLARLDALLEHVPADVDPDLLTAALVALESLPPEVGQDLADSLVRRVALRLGWAQARHDQRLPDGVVEALVTALGHRDQRSTTAACLAIAERLTPAALDATAAHVVRHHPSVAALCWELTVRVTLHVDPEDASLFMSSATPAPRDLRWILRQAHLGPLPAWQHLLITVVTIPFAFVVVFGFAGQPSWGALVGAVACGLVLDVTIDTALSAWRAHRADLDLAYARLIAHAREHALFPLELAVITGRVWPAPTALEELRVHSDADPARLLEEDPLALFRVITPAHLARVQTLYREGA